MQTAITRHVVYRTQAGGTAVRETHREGGRLLGYTVPGTPGDSYWSVAVRRGEGEPWGVRREPDGVAAEKALREELRLPQRVCPVCEEEPGGPWCDGHHTDDADVTDYATLPDIHLGGGSR